MQKKVAHRTRIGGTVGFQMTGHSTRCGSMEYSARIEEDLRPHFPDSAWYQPGSLSLLGVSEVAQFQSWDAVSPWIVLSLRIHCVMSTAEALAIQRETKFAQIPAGEEIRETLPSLKFEQLKCPPSLLPFFASYRSNRPSGETREDF